MVKEAFEVAFWSFCEQARGVVGSWRSTVFSVFQRSFLFFLVGFPSKNGLRHAKTKKLRLQDFSLLGKSDS